MKLKRKAKPDAKLRDMTVMQLKRELRLLRTKASAQEEREQRQQQAGDRVREVWGAACLASPHERVMRLQEEVLKLAQAMNVPFHDLFKLFEVVSHRPSGEIEQELGGVCVTLLSLAQSLGFSLEEIERIELDRFLAADIEKMRRKGAEKNALGVSIAPRIREEA
jgi:hypothetical protein